MFSLHRRCHGRILNMYVTGVFIIGRFRVIRLLPDNYDKIVTINTSNDMKQEN